MQPWREMLPQLLLLLILLLNALRAAAAAGYPPTGMPTGMPKSGGTFRHEIRMPGIRTSKEDEYICVGWDIPEDDLYVVEFEALADGSTVHHMILNSCGSADVSVRKDCSMSCDSDEKIMFAWGRNAPPTQLPKDVGFRVGRQSGSRYLILQLHYRMPMSQSDAPDVSGVRISLTKSRQRYIAGIYLFIGGSSFIPARTEKVVVDAVCKYSQPATLYPFAFRTHSHALGTVITGYHGNGSWHLLAKGSPQWPQAFYPIQASIVIKTGDYVVARCTYNSSSRDTNTFFGKGHSDEMCNLYLMYYTQTGSSFYGCYENVAPKLIAQLPPGSDTPPPLNPALDAAASENHHHPGPLEKGAQPPHRMTTLVYPLVLAERLRTAGVSQDRDQNKVEPMTGWPPEPLLVGQIAAVATDWRGNVHIFHRGTQVWDATSFDDQDRFLRRSDGPIREPTLLELDGASGRVVHQWANSTFYMPHGLHIDAHGAFWLTDVALHQVLRYARGASAPGLVLGVQFEPGSDTRHFCKPAAVATLDSEFFVADGYCNRRIIKFSLSGQFVAQWGEAGTGSEPPGGSAVGGGVGGGVWGFNVPHSVVVLGDRGEVCVADRENARLLCYTTAGRLLRRLSANKAFQPKLFAIDYSNITGYLYSVGGPDTGQKAQPPLFGATVDPDSGVIVNTFSPPSPGFAYPHDLAVSRDGECIYVVELMPPRLLKFHNYAAPSASHQSVKKSGVQSVTPSFGGGQGAEKTPGGAQHPDSLDGGTDGSGGASSVLEGGGEGPWVVSLIIAAVLVVPVLALVCITAGLRLRRRGCRESCSCCKGSSSKNRRFNPGSLLSRHSGFSLLSTMDNYLDPPRGGAGGSHPELAPLQSDEEGGEEGGEEGDGESETEEFSTPLRLQRA